MSEYQPSDDELRAIADEARRYRTVVNFGPYLLDDNERSYACGVVAERLRTRARVAELERAVAALADEIGVDAADWMKTGGGEP